MRERLIQHVEQLFAGASGVEDMKQEILQNTLDRYDDLISQGKTEEAAYRLAISGIGDINELLDTPAAEGSAPAEEEPGRVRKLRATAIALYVACSIPLFLFGGMGRGTVALSLTALLAAVATYLMILSRRSGPKQQDAPAPPKDPRKERIHKILTPIMLLVYFLLSFSTGAWFITWLVFPITGCIKGLINAIIDLKED